MKNNNRISVFKTGSSKNDVMQFLLFLTPIVTLFITRFYIFLLHKILDSLLPQTLTSFMDDPIDLNYQALSSIGQFYIRIVFPLKSNLMHRFKPHFPPTSTTTTTKTLRALKMNARLFLNFCVSKNEQKKRVLVFMTIVS